MMRPGKRWPSDCLTTAVLLAAGTALAVMVLPAAWLYLAARP